MKVKKGDNVIVISGKDKGKKGTVTKAMPKENKILVEGVNMRKVHLKKGQKGAQKGQVVEKNMPVQVSNVMIVDSSSGKPTRVGYKMEADKKVRVAKVSGKNLK